MCLTCLSVSLLIFLSGLQWHQSIVRHSVRSGHLHEANPEYNAVEWESDRQRTA